MKKMIKLGLFAGIIAFGCASAVASDSYATFPGQNGAIVLSSTRETPHDYEIFSMNPDGSNPIRISNHAGNDYAPVWSPDGTKIVFYTYGRNANYNEIFTMNPDGTNQVNLTPGQVSVTPSWSPDGTKIVYASQTAGNLDIFVMNADGSSQTRLTTATGSDIWPVWSPDGTKIAFRSARDGKNEVYIMDANGSNQTRLTNNGVGIHSADPDFSPDGTKLLFTSNMSGNYQLYTMDLNGSNMQQVGVLPTPHNTYSPFARWSPDGTKILFSSYAGMAGGSPFYRAYVMNANGSNLTAVTESDQSSDSGPSWQPLSYTYTPTVPATAPSLLTFTSLGALPSANNEPSRLGKRISDLLVYNNKIYPAFGDATDNYGPVDLELYDLSTRIYTGPLLTLQTESLSPFKALSSGIYAPTYDPIGAGPAGYARSNDNGASWVTNLPITGRHLLDIQEYNGDLFAAGAQGSAGIIWRSTDDGATWSVSLSQTSPYSTNVRFYWMLEMNGLLYAQASIPDSPVQVFNGTSWSAATTNPVSYYWQRPILFKNKIISQLNGMSSYDGTTVSVVSNFSGIVRDFYVDGDYLYVLRDNNSVVRTTDLLSWESLGSVPTGAYSLAIYNDRLYIGAYGALIYESSLISTALASQSANNGILAPTGVNSYHTLALAAVTIIAAVISLITVIEHRRRIV
ncbi:MAG: hypothetical protein WBP12_03410 [Candidatus Saccharimonas sp.]